MHKIVKIWTTVGIVFLRWKYYTTENMCITSKRVTQNYHLYLWSAAWFGSRLSTQNTLSQHEGNEIIFKIFKKYLSCSAGGLLWSDMIFHLHVQWLFFAQQLSFNITQTQTDFWTCFFVCLFNMKRNSNCYIKQIIQY